MDYSYAAFMTTAAKCWTNRNAVECSVISSIDCYPENITISVCDPEFKLTTTMRCVSHELRWRYQTRYWYTCFVRACFDEHDAKMSISSMHLNVLLESSWAVSNDIPAVMFNCKSPLKAL